MLFPIILCGGSGTRLWPLSRKAYPKQFIDLTNSGRTMLQSTLTRLNGLESSDPIVVCSHENRFLVAQQLQEIEVRAASILLEPAAKNTAPAVACAALKALDFNSDAVMLVMPADHLLEDMSSFEQAVEKALIAANNGHLVTFGVTPFKPETGYGYIRKGNVIDEGILSVEAFKEKPDSLTAQRYIDSGDFLWNSGMFVFKASSYVEELEKFSPETLESCRQALQNSREDLDFCCLEETAFKTCPEDSIDYAVMEKTDRCAVVELEAGWSDIGSWSSLWDVQSKDENDNATSGDTILADVKSSLIHSEDRLVAVLGVDNLIVVDTPDAVMVADRSKVQSLKSIVKMLEQEDRSEAVF